MNNISLIINAILAVAVIILFVLVLGKKSEKNTQTVVEGKTYVATTAKLPIAYINVDSLLSNYTFAKESNESLIKKQEDSRLTINTQARQLQAEMADFQRKLDNNAFLSRDRAEQEQVRLQKKQQALQELDGKLSQQLVQVQQKMSEQLRDTINKFLKEYNKTHNYQMIISNTANDNILYADKAYDITAEVTKLLNERVQK
jgi:outer membrane protein